MPEKYIMPMKILNINQCPACEADMILVEESYSTANLNQQGLPMFNGCDEEVDVKLLCPVCGAEYEAEKVGAFFRIKRTTPSLKKYRNRIEEFNPFYAHK